GAGRRRVNGRRGDDSFGARREREQQADAVHARGEEQWMCPAPSPAGTRARRRRCREKPAPPDSSEVGAARSTVPIEAGGAGAELEQPGRMKITSLLPPSPKQISQSKPVEKAKKVMERHFDQMKDVFEHSPLGKLFGEKKPKNEDGAQVFVRMMKKVNDKSND